MSAATRDEHEPTVLRGDCMPRFTDGRVPSSGIAELFTAEHRWQRWLDVEAALAMAQAAQDTIPADSAVAISEACHVDALDLDKVREGIRRQSHPLTPLIEELARAAGEDHGGWVHWGVTTQNVTQTGDVLVLREAHEAITRLMGGILSGLAGLAEREAETVMAGRTHGQHAVPITFGLKSASWADEFGRHVERLDQIRPRLLVCLLGGAAGTYAALGENPIALHAAVADRLGLRPMQVPARNIVDHLAELGCLLGLIASTCGRIAHEVYALMGTELGEAEEPVPEGTIGSSTMPQKRNPQLCQDVIGMTAQVRAQVPLILEATRVDHEADNNPSLLFDALAAATTLTGDLLSRIEVIVSGLVVDRERMRHNLEITGGMISAEAVMLELASSIGRNRAHEVVHQAAWKAATSDLSFVEVLDADPTVCHYLDETQRSRLLDPLRHTGQAANIARATAARARQLAAEITK